MERYLHGLLTGADEDSLGPTDAHAVDNVASEAKGNDLGNTKDFTLESFIINNI